MIGQLATLRPSLIIQRNGNKKKRTTGAALPIQNGTFRNANFQMSSIAHYNLYMVGRRAVAKLTLWIFEFY